MHTEPEFYKGAIAEAADLLGGLEYLAVILNVKLAELRDWSEGNAYPGPEVFHRIVEIREQCQAITRGSAV